MVNAVKVFTLRLCISAYYIHFKRVKVKIFTAFTIDTVLKNAKGYYEFVGTKGNSRVILRFNINSFRNGYTISDLLKMDLSVYAIKVGKTSLDNLDVNKELGMNVSIIPKDNPSYNDNSEKDEAKTDSPVLDVFDVLLAGVEAND